MGFYVGPYFECRNEPKPRLEFYYACVSPQCAVHERRIPKVKFCSECGGRIGEFTFQKPDTQIDHESVCCATREALIYANMADAEHIHYWIPDWVRPDHPAQKRGFCIDCCGALRLNEIFVNQEIHWLNKAFAAEAKILDEFYGRKNVRVEVGILSYLTL